MNELPEHYIVPTEKDFDVTIKNGEPKYKNVLHRAAARTGKLVREHPRKALRGVHRPDARRSHCYPLAPSSEKVAAVDAAGLHWHDCDPRWAPRVRATPASAFPPIVPATRPRDRQREDERSRPPFVFCLLVTMTPFYLSRPSRVFFNAL